MAREKRFAENEIWALIEAVEPVFDKLVGQLSNSLTSERKDRLWSGITHAVNAVNADVVRTKKKVFDKWTYLKSEARLAGMAYKRASQTTGGGGAPKSPKPYLKKILEMLPQESIYGIDGCERWVHCQLDHQQPVVMFNNYMAHSIISFHVSTVLNFAPQQSVHFLAGTMVSFLERHGNSSSHHTRKKTMRNKLYNVE